MRQTIIKTKTMSGSVCGKHTCDLHSLYDDDWI